MINGVIIIIKVLIINIENYIVLLFVEIWLGGIKLRINVSNELRKLRLLIIYIKLLFFLLIWNGWLVFFML